MNIAIIPARGGSKRIPKKNIKNFLGKPIIAYAIESALQAGCFDRIIVSTDDPDIARISRNYQAEVPFMRPENLADDYSTTMDVIEHVIKELEVDQNLNDIVTCIYPTAVFTTPTILKHAISLVKGTDYVIPVCEYTYPIQRALKKENGFLTMIDSSQVNTRSQDLQAAYHDTGQFYMGPVSSWIERRPILSSRVLPIIVDRWKAVDIDTLDDWHLAEMLYRAFSDEH